MAVCCVRYGSAFARIACLSLAALPLAASAAGIESCPEAGVSFQTIEASSARDSTTILLKDGREVRLAGVAAVDDLKEDEASAARSVAALNERVAGKSLLLYGPPSQDRYGRLIGQVALAGDKPHWLQADLVAAGLVRVAPESSEIACAVPLLGFEKEARETQQGFWKEPRFSVKNADQIDAMTAMTGHFAVVEGVIHRVGETSSRTYLDFGRRYNEDFTIVIPRSARREFATAGIDLKSLRGRHVRVRGVLFSSGGPAIEIRKPASLEILASDGT